MTTPDQQNESLALAFQEVLTATVRLRANRQQVSDAESFRNQIRAGIRAARQEARVKGYSDDDFRLAAFAVVAFIDESVLNSRNPVFASWPRKPLQEELFGGHIAGETLFENLSSLLRDSDSTRVADVLEVYDLCLLLGYQGRYTSGNSGELQGLKRAISEKLHRIRGYQPLAPDWAPPAASSPHIGSDTVLRRLGYAAVACFVLAALLFAAFHVLLHSGISVVQDSAVAGIGGVQ